MIYRKGRRIVGSRLEVTTLEFNPIQVMPPVGALAKKEKILNEDYVQSNINTNLSPFHFRNQLHKYGQHFETFQSLTEGSWPHSQINSLDIDQGELSLLVRDGGFVAEVGWVGQGLQSWLQTTWFLSRVNEKDTVVFDEPDVYLHADLQRKLIRFLGSKYRQTIVATHSLEIISDVSPENIVVVDKVGSASNAAPSLPAVQAVMDNLGGAYNLQLMRLWNARKCLFVEGKDMDFLDVFHSKICPDSEMPLRSIPNIPLGGGGNWQHAVGAALGFRNAGDKKIVTYCIVDRDYRTLDDINKIEKSAISKGLDLIFWKRKEIENYILAPNAIRRFVVMRKRTVSSKGPQLSTIEKRIDTICQDLKQDVIDSTAEEIWKMDKHLSLSKANKSARAIVQESWGTPEGRVSLVPGKKVFSELSKWSKKNYGVSFGPLAIAREMNADELNDEIADIILAIDKGHTLPR